MNNTKHTAFVNGLKSLLQDDSVLSKQGISSQDELFDDKRCV